MPLSINQLSRGKFKYHGISLLQVGQNERRGSLTLSPRGIRYMTTFKKEPMHAPNNAKHSGNTHAFSVAISHIIMSNCSCMLLF